MVGKGLFVGCYLLDALVDGPGACVASYVCNIAEVMWCIIAKCIYITIYTHYYCYICIYMYIYFFSICKTDASIYSGPNRLVDFGNYVGNLDLPRVSTSLQHFQSRIVSSINSWHVGKARCIRSGVSLPASTESSCCMRCSSCCCSSLQWSKTQRFRDR